MQWVNMPVIFKIDRYIEQSKMINSFNHGNIPNKEGNNIIEPNLANPPLSDPNKPIIDHPAQSSRQHFQDLLTCHICFCHANSPMMCPFCSKLYCQGCIRRCLLLKSQCPHCRKQIKGIAMMASCNRFINQLVTIVNDLIDHKVQQQICSQHDIQINYYCQDCSQPVCCQCKMFGKHQTHSLTNINKIYQARYDVLREMLSEFKTKLKDKQLNLKDIQGELLELKKLKDKHLKQLEQFTEHYRVKIIQESTSEAQEIENELTQYDQLIQALVKIEEQLNTKAEEAENSNKFILDDGLVDRINTITEKQPCKDNKNRKTVLEEVIPPFFESSFVIKNYSKKKKQRTIVFSPAQKFQGSEWRLKIYPNGNESVQGNYLSVFIEMVATIHQSTVYEYQIELVNKKNPNQRMIKEYQSTFQPGESWGYNKYIKVQNLIREGYVDPVTDELEVHYYIRNPFYYNIYKQKQLYIETLDTQILKQEAEIKELEGLLGGKGKGMLSNAKENDKDKDIFEKSNEKSNEKKDKEANMEFLQGKIQK